jgi:hypothetical protein
MAQTHAKNSHDLPNSNSKTVSLTFHLYPRHYTEFVTICEELEKFHSEILRDLVIDFIKKHKEKPQKKASQAQSDTLEDIDTLGEPQKKASQKQSGELEAYLRHLRGDSVND